MASVRIRGRWALTLTTFKGGAPGAIALGECVLEILKATRTGLEGEISIGRRRARVVGKVKPGSPAVVTLTEAGKDGSPIEDGLEAVLYIPPWWPTVDYSYDYITGTMVVGENSSMGSDRLRGGLISVTGVQPFE